MATVFHNIKLGVSVLFGAASAVCVFVAMPYAVPTAVVSIAFSLMPE